MKTPVVFHCALGGIAALSLLMPVATKSSSADGLPTLAVFPFECVDDSAAGAAFTSASAIATSMTDVTASAQRILAQSGKYRLIEMSSAAPLLAQAAPLRSCDGCEAAIAQGLGAQFSLIGVVVKAEQASYAIEMQMRDTATGKVVWSTHSVFLGGRTEWPSGVRSAIRHELLHEFLSSK